MTRSRYRVASAPQALRYPLPSRPVAVRLRLVDSQPGCRIVVGQVLAVRPLEQTAHGSEKMLGLKRCRGEAVRACGRRGCRTPLLTPWRRRMRPRPASVIATMGRYRACMGGHVGDG